MSTDHNAVAWRQGVQLAIDMLEAADDLDEMSLSDRNRGGRPQKNVVATFLQRLRAINDRRVEAAFGAVLSDYIAGAEDGGVPDLALLHRLAQWPIETEVCS